MGCLVFDGILISRCPRNYPVKTVVFCFFLSFFIYWKNYLFPHQLFDGGEIASGEYNPWKGAHCSQIANYFWPFQWTNLGKFFFFKSRV